MNRWFTKLAMVLLPSFVVSFAPVNAAYDACNPCYVDPCSDTCNPCADWCSGFEIGADFIWWKPCIDNLDYAVQFTADFTPPVTATGSYRHVHPNWEPGVRAYIAVEDIWGGLDLIGSYTWIKVQKHSNSTTTVAGTLFSTQFNPAIITAGEGFTALSSKYKLNYQTFDVLLASECCLCEHVFIPFFGITGVFLDQNIDSDGTTAVTALVSQLRWRSDYWGIGLKVGSEYKYTFCDGFGFFACASGSIVAGEVDTTRTETADATGTPVTPTLNNDDECHFLNGYHIAAGFLYEDCWCNWDFALRLGYEFVKWHNVSTLRRFTSTAVPQVATSGSPYTTTLGFHGLFAGLSISF